MNAVLSAANAVWRREWVEAAAVALEGLGERGETHAGRQLAHGRQRAREAPVHEDQPVPAEVAERHGIEVDRGTEIGARGHGSEGALLEGREAGVLPVLVAPGRQACYREALQGIASQARDGWGLRAGQRRSDALEVGDEGQGGRCGHDGRAGVAALPSVAAPSSQP
jgi:hypothetical protein